MKKLFVFLFLLCNGLLIAQVNFTAKDVVNPYEGPFRPGTNLGYFPNFSSSDLGDLAAGNPAEGIMGVGAKVVRPVLAESVLEIFGYDVVVDDFEHWKSLGMDEFTATLAFPVDWHRDWTEYCPGTPSNMFANLHTPIWDNGENGTPFNDENYFAAYVYKTVSTYNEYVRFWEILNEPGFDLTGQTGWREPGYTGGNGNWWDNDPDPCDYILHAPIEHYVRTIRIAYEIIKTIAPEDYVVVAGLGYQSFLDAILRNTDNPDGGSVTAEYPEGAGAYFDIMGLHSYPHIDGTTRLSNIQFFERHSDRAAEGLIYRRDFYQEVFDNYGYDGNTYPKKLTLATEMNIPREFDGNDTYLGGTVAQRNYIMKSFITAILNDVIQFNVFGMSDNPGSGFGFDKMGLYRDLEVASPGNVIPNEEAFAMKTTADLLWNTNYDASKTAQLNVPNGVKGYAFQRQDGKYLYMLWAETTIDQSEFAEENYSFPSSFGYSTLEKYEWDYSQTSAVSEISVNNIDLDATPIFLVESGADIGTTVTINCPADITLTVPFGTNGIDVFWDEPTTSTNCSNPNITITQTSGASNGGFFPLGFTQIGYQANNDCGQTAFCNFSINIQQEDEPTDDYCLQEGSTPWAEWIAGVQIANINNESGKCDTECGYGDFTDLVVNLNVGTTYDITLIPGKSWDGYLSDIYWSVWIDWNQDGDFTDAGETTLEEYGGNQPLDASISVSANVTQGTTRMRIAAQRGSFLDPCTSFERGEIEDYTLNITDGIVDICDLSGQDCNDEDECTTNDVYDDDCNCVGVFTDSDYDGVCNALDVCPNSDDNLDFNNNGVPDGCENFIDPGGYCLAEAAAPWQQYIRIIRINDLSNESGKCAATCGYGDFTSLSTTVEKGASYTFELTAKYSWQAGDEYWRVWIDWNNNEHFSGSEIVYSKFTPALPDGIGTHTVSGTLNIPLNASTGEARIRIALSGAEGYPDACGLFNQGEVEDYTINIVEPGQSLNIGAEPGNPNAANEIYQNNLAAANTDDLISLYPNPSSGILFVDVAQYRNEIGTIRIYDNLGQVIEERNLEEIATDVIEFDLREMRAGMYFTAIRPKNKKPKVQRFSLIRL